MVLAAGGAVDFTRYYNAQQNVQTALDAAVLAGAAADNDDTIASNTFTSWKLNFNGTVDTPSYSASETDEASYYTGTVEVHLNMTFAALVGFSQLDYTVNSKAERLKSSSGSGGTPCAWIGQGGMDMGSNARFMAPNCQVDIRGGDAGFSSGSQMMTSRLCIGTRVGDPSFGGKIFDPQKRYPVQESCPAPTSYTLPPRPAFNSCDHPDRIDYKYADHNSLTLKPGTFCGGLYFHGGPNSSHPMQITLAPGLYELSGAPFQFDGYVELYGYGVTFYFQDAKSWLKFNGDHITTELTAPTSGDCEDDDRCGVLMYEPSSLVNAGYSTPAGFGLGASHAWTGNIMLPSRWLNQGSDACNHDRHMDIYGRMAVYGMRVCGDSRWRFWPRKTEMTEACPSPRPQWWPALTAKKVCMPNDRHYGVPGNGGGPDYADGRDHAGGPYSAPAESCFTEKTFADQWWYSWWHYWRHDNEAPKDGYACTCPGPEGGNWTYGKFPGGAAYSPLTWRNGHFASFAYPSQAPWPYHHPCACHSETWHPWHQICEDDEGNYNGDGDGNGDGSGGDDDSDTTYSLPHLIR